MQTVLQTKLHRPVPRHDLVARPDLLSRLDNALQRPLTLVSAPAGYGKTTLVATWLAQQSPLSAVWLSLDSEDNDVARFFAHLLTGLMPHIPESVPSLLTLLYTSAGGGVQGVVAGLLNALAALDTPLVLAFDDYHVIEARPIHHAMQQLLDHLPADVHLLLLTRADPPLALPRWRVRQQLLEIRAADLRFDVTETAAFMALTAGIKMNEAQIAQIAAKTEGWAAALQLVALSMPRQTDIDQFINALSGAQRYIVDYLVDEALSQLPVETQKFLLNTAVLTRLCAPLCTALTDNEDSQAMLEALERLNLFLVPLDDERRWYRYHYLFAQFLLNRLGSASAQTQHEKAAVWLANNDLQSEAIQHALAAQNFALAGQLMEALIRPLFAQANLTTLFHWYSALPREIYRQDPALQLSFALVLHAIGQNSDTYEHLQEAEQHAELVPAAQKSHWQASLATIHALVAAHALRVEDALRWAEQALALLPAEDAYTRAGVHYARAIALNTAVDKPETALQTLQDFDETIRYGRQAGHFLLVADALNQKGYLLRAMGRATEARRMYEQVAALQAEMPTLAKLTMYEGLAMAYYDQNQIGTARAIYDTHRLMDHAAQIEMPRARFSLMASYAILLLADGEPESALSVMAQAHDLAVGADDVLLLRQSDAYRVWIEAQQGDLTAAGVWATRFETETAVATRLRRDYWQETIIWLQICLWQQRYAVALETLAPLFTTTQQAGRMGHYWELQVLEVAALAGLERGDEALAVLTAVLSAALPEKVLRIFWMGGQPVRALLQKLNNRRPAPDAIMKSFIGEALALFDQTAPAAPRNILLDIEPLTGRETEILRLIELGLTNKTIADRLVISMATVKKHISNIFLKLDVQNRTQALSRAREYQLL